MNSIVADATARAENYSGLLVLLLFSIFYFSVTIIQNPLLPIVSPSAFRSKWFDNLWRKIGPQMAANEIQINHIEELLSRAGGTVLELGPGGGDQMYHYKASQIELYYAVEPNIFLHSMLLEKANAAGLSHKAVILEASAQPESLLPALKSAGLIPKNAQTLPEDGIFDSVVAIKSLCSVPHERVATAVAIIQALLKPGGEFLFFEHVASQGDIITQTYAWLVNMIWPSFMGGCRLDGKLDKIVAGMGGWESQNIQTLGDSRKHEVLRYVKGIVRKA